MRPLALTVKGFTCFKEEQGPIELSKLDLFAISGPTGAGKSSILDAMVFALYGRVPRMGAQHLAELISLGSDRLYVVFEFALGERRYRLFREAKRKKTGGALLEEFVNGTAKPVADGLTNVDGEVQRLLGLRYDAFVQAVVLPQGEFHKFLKSQPGQRRQILRDLLRLEVYERMRKSAQKEQDKLEGQVRNLDNLLQTEYAGVTVEALEQAQAKREELVATNKVARRELGERETAVAELRARCEKTIELAAKTAALKRIVAREPEINQGIERVKRAARAAVVLPKLEAVRAAEQTAEEEEARRVSAVAIRVGAHATHTTAAQQLAEAKLASKEIASLRARIAALDELKGVLEARAGAQARQAKALREKAAAERELAAADAEVALAAKQRRDVAAALKKAQKAVQQCDYDETLAHRLDSVRELATELLKVRESMEELTHDAVECDNEARRAHDIAKQAAASLERATVAVTKCEERYQKAEDAFRDGDRRHAACGLRASLEAGKPCPVCAQPVSKLPRQEKVPELDALAAKRDEARIAAQQARSERAESAAGHARAEATAVQAQTAAEAAAKKVEKAAGREKRLEAELTGQVGDAVDRQRGKTIEAKILTAVRSLAEAREGFQQATKLSQEAALAAQKSEHREEQASGKALACKQRISESGERVSGCRNEVEELTARISKVTTAADPLAERALLDERIRNLEQALKMAEDAERSAATALAAAERGANESMQASDRAREAASKAHQRAHEAALEAGFADEVVAAEAALPYDTSERLQKDIDVYHRERHATDLRIKELERELQGQRVSDPELREAERELDQRKRSHEVCIRDEATLKAKVADLEKRLKTAAAHAADLATARAKYRVHKCLADDLRGDAFQAYLLEEAVSDLLAGASSRFMALSGRYTFASDADDFFVLDHDNAQERRSADTLSGGETFLASLSLALELSEQVQRAAGAVRLDSLFIDEGFGTLDPETLDVVASAIQSLKAGGRMVGIITHIPELTAQFTERIVVEKRSEGSRVHIEAD